MNIKFSEKKEVEEKTPEKTEEKVVEKTEEKTKKDPMEEVVETIRGIKQSVEDTKESVGGMKSRLDLIEEEKEESFNSTGDDLFNEAEKEVDKEEEETTKPEKKEGDEDEGIDEAIKHDQEFRDNVIKSTKILSEKQDAIEKRFDEDNLNREVNESIKEFPDVKKSDILRGIEEDPNKTASEIAKSLDEDQTKTRATMRDEIKKELEEETTKEQKGNVSVPQSSGTSKDSSTQPSEPEGDPWEAARTKAKSELSEE